MESRYVAQSITPPPQDVQSLTSLSLPEIFLPSYVECDFESLERKRDPVHEIVLSDEEIQSMFPQ
jgi:hypothetical protein